MTVRGARIFVGISGGVDSTVAALLLKQQGHEVTGVFMKNWEEDDTAEHCGAEEDLRMARAVCARLDIPLHPVNFATEYWERVFTHFLAEYQAGRTPNPDVLCNKEIKFRAFIDYAETLGADGIATGHYARRDSFQGRWRLLRARDDSKDQTYFLYALSQAQLARVEFPLGELTKAQVRAMARAAGLPNHDRRDSTGICFIGERNFGKFLARFLPSQPGDIRALDGTLKGHHAGLMFHTIGQRHGLGIGGPGAPWYVVDKDMARNTLYVAQGDQHPALYSSELWAADLHWIAGTAPADSFECRAMTRYRQPDQRCRLELLTSGEARVAFDAPQRAVTPGQAVVFYRAGECLGGGVIAHAAPRARQAAGRATSPTAGAL